MLLCPIAGSVVVVSLGVGGLLLPEAKKLLYLGFV